MNTKSVWKNFCGPLRSGNCKWQVALIRKLVHDFFSHKILLYKNIPSSWKFKAQQINTAGLGLKIHKLWGQKHSLKWALAQPFSELGPAGICQVRSWVWCKFCPWCPSFPDRGRCKVRSSFQWGIFEVPMAARDSALKAAVGGVGLTSGSFPLSAWRDRTWLQGWRGKGFRCLLFVS